MQTHRHHSTAPVRQPFGAVDGRDVELFTLRNASGICVRISNYGGIIVALETPDRHGRMSDVVLGFDTVDEYVRGSAYFGAVVGRYAGRIAHARFALNGSTCELTPNDGDNHLHGGLRGFDRAVWEAELFDVGTDRGLMLRHASADGEEGYPGRLEATVVYTLTDADELVVDYLAVCDRPTPVNLTQHSYFNLGGAGSGNVLDHELMIRAARFLPMTAALIPTGALAPVAHTPFDFRRSRAVGELIDTDHPQLRIGRGYDHTFVLDRSAPVPQLAARLQHATSGRVLEVHTTEPAVQLYSGNFLDGSTRGKGGRSYGARGGICLETQHFPDAPNRPHFPATILHPGREYRSRTIFAFSTVR